MRAQALGKGSRGRGPTLSRQSHRLGYYGLSGAIAPRRLAALQESDSQRLMFRRSEDRAAEQEQRRLKGVSRRGLITEWSREPSWIALHNPATGEW